MEDDQPNRSEQERPQHRQRSNTPLWIGLGFAVLCLLGVGLILALPGNTLHRTAFFGPDTSPTAESTPGLPGDPTGTPAGTAAPTVLPLYVPTTDPTLPTTTPIPTDPTPPTAEPSPSIINPPTVAPPSNAGNQIEDVVKIGVDLPTSGADAADGVPTRNGVELAIDQANAADGIILGNKRYRLEMYALDDAVNGIHNPQQAAKNAYAIIADPAVLAVVGPLNDDNAQTMLRPLNEADLTLISPSNTSPYLTKPNYGVASSYEPTGKRTYFRISTTDDLQGVAAADYLFDRLNAKNIAILDDTDLYGKMFADAVEQRFRLRGGTVAERAEVAKGTQDFRTILTKLAAINPHLDALFYGGTTSNGLALARLQMADAGLNIPFIGGDGILGTEFVNIARDAANGSYASRSWTNAAILPGAAPFIAAYRARFNADIGEYSAQAYDATNIIIDAIRRANHPSREAVRAAIAATDYQGVLGHTRFDANGDTTNRWISVFTIQNGHWVFTDQMQAADMAVAPAVSSPTSTAVLPSTPPTPSIPAQEPRRVQKIGLVGDVGIITDGGFNQASWEGVQQAASVLGAKTHYIETHDPKDYALNIDQLVAAGYDPIVTVGAPIGEATVEAARQHPEIVFIGINQYFTAPSRAETPHLSNYADLIFHEDRAGFLAGALAGLMSKSRVVGAVLGTDVVPAVWRYGEGFRAGAQYIQPNIKIQLVYHNDVDLSKTFYDPAWAKVTAISLIDKGADVIFGVGGTTGIGALLAAAEHRNIYAIGSETDQYPAVPEARSVLLSSAMKRVTPGLAAIIQQIRDGTFTPGNNYGAVGLASFHELAAQVPDAVYNQLAAIEQGLNQGIISTNVPEIKP